jgi:hypothetical protein
MQVISSLLGTGSPQPTSLFTRFTCQLPEFFHTGEWEPGECLAETLPDISVFRSCFPRERHERAARSIFVTDWRVRLIVFLSINQGSQVACRRYGDR